MSAVAMPERGLRPRRRGQARPASQGVALCLGMLRAAVLGSQLALVLAAGAGWLWAGPTGAANSLVASAIVISFFASGQGVQLLAAEMDGTTGMLLVLASYLVRVVLLGALLWFATAHQAQLEDHFLRGIFFGSAVTTLTGWIGGVLVGHSRQHVYAYDHQYDRANTVGGGV